MLGLSNSVGENLTVINFDGKTVWNTSYLDLVEKFCEWRLTWYVKRYQRLADLLEIDIQKYKDILLAIKKDVGSNARKVNNRGELKEYLKALGIVYVDYIADLAVYRFTQEEKEKVERKLIDAEELLCQYKSLLSSKNRRKEVYISELKEVLTKHKRGYYV